MVLIAGGIFIFWFELDVTICDRVLFSFPFLLFSSLFTTLLFTFFYTSIYIPNLCIPAKRETPKYFQPSFFSLSPEPLNVVRNNHIENYTFLFISLDHCPEVC